MAASFPGAEYSRGFVAFLEVAAGEGRRHRVPIALGLDDDLAAKDRAGVVRDAVAAVARGLASPHLKPELFEQTGDARLDFLRRQLHEVRALIQRRQHVRFLNEARAEDQ